MKEGIVIYRSKYGATKRYARWLAETLNFEMKEIKQSKIGEIAAYDKIVFCGAVYASGIVGLKFLKKHIKPLQGKTIAILCVGASPYDEKFLDAIKNHNFTDEMKHIPLFYGRGAWNEDKMTFLDRTLCKMLQKAVSKKDPSVYEPWETALISATGKHCDWTDKKYLEPLLRYMGK